MSFKDLQMDNMQDGVTNVSYNETEGVTCVYLKYILTQDGMVLYLNYIQA